MSHNQLGNLKFFRNENTPVIEKKPFLIQIKKEGATS